jgi:hypothetical protein
MIFCCFLDNKSFCGEKYPTYEEAAKKAQSMLASGLAKHIVVYEAKGSFILETKVSEIKL